MKNIILGLVIILAILSCGLAYFANSKSFKSQESLNKERYLRMQNEEVLQNIETKIKSLEEELGRKDKKIEALTLQLDQLNAHSQELEGRLQKAAEIKENLDQKITELQNAVAVTVIE